MDMQNTLDEIPAEIVKAESLWDLSGKAIIEHGPWAAAFVLVFVACFALVAWVLRTSAKEVRLAHENVQNTNERNAQLATTMAKTSAQLVDRLDRVVSMQDRMLDLLQVIVGGKRDVPPDNTEDGPG